MVDIRLGTEFKRQFKRLMKKYPSLLEDLKTFKQDLEINPQQGVALGAHLYKVRMAIASKGKGKSAGARVITYRILVKQECIEITLLTIYDKNEIENVSDEYLQSFLWLKRCLVCSLYPLYFRPKSAGFSPHASVSHFRMGLV